ncbi:MAG: hypothetical protein ACR2LR_00795 [Hassallia sp.]
MLFKTLFNGRNAVRMEKLYKLITQALRSPPLMYYFLRIIHDNEREVKFKHSLSYILMPKHD